jgi:hypothetical protein
MNELNKKDYEWIAEFVDWFNDLYPERKNEALADKVKAIIEQLEDNEKTVFGLFHHREFK